MAESERAGKAAKTATKVIKSAAVQASMKKASPVKKVQPKKKSNRKVS